MALSSSVINKFVEVTQSPETSTGYYSYGTAIVNGDDKYVQLDGAESVTSISVATDVATGDRVLLYIENHTATVVGNITCPASGRTAISVSQDLLDFETIAVGRLDAVQADIEEVYANYVSTMYLFADYVTANYILAETVAANYATIGELTALHEYVDSLEASEITVEYLEANYANIASLVAVEEYVTQLAAEMITTDYLQANYATIEDLDATNINVTTLSADYSNLKYILAGYESVEDLQSIHLTADNVVIDNAIITDAMIADLSASKLTAGTIYTSLVKIQTAENDTSLYFNDSLIQMSENDLVRFQAGKDATGEYGLYIWNSEGKIMFDATGATSDGIGKEVIVNDMVADTANIAGYKLDIDSVVSCINDNGNLQVDSSHITINGNTLDYEIDSIIQQIEGLELEEGVTKVIPYFALSGSPDNPPASEEDFRPAYADEAIADCSYVDVYNYEDLWSIDQPIGSDQYLWVKFKFIYSNDSESWSDPILLSDGYLRQVTTAIQTEIEVIQGQISLKVWESDIESAVNTAITDLWSQIVVEIDNINLAVGDLTSDVYSMSNTISEINIELGEMLLTVSDVYTAAVSSVTVYFAVSSSPDNPPVSEEDFYPAYADVARVDCSYVDVYEYVDLWTTNKPTPGDDQYVWAKLLYTYLDGSTGWSEPFLYTDERLLDEMILNREAISNIELTLEGISLTTYSEGNGMARIILKNGSEESDVEVVEEAAKAFEYDLNNNKSSIYIEAGSITFNSGTSISFNSGTLTINSENFTLDSGGNVTMNKAYATNLTVTGDSSFYGDIEAKTISLISDYAYFFFDRYKDIDFEKEYYLRLITAYEIEEGYWDSTGLYFGNNFIGLYSGANPVNTVDEICPSSYNRSVSDICIDSGEISIWSSGDLYIRAQDRLSMNATTNNGILRFCNLAGEGDTMIRFESYSGKRISVGVGSGGSNRGLYDNESGGWLVYADSDNDFHFGKSTIGSSTRAMYLSGGIPTAGFSVEADSVSITPSAANTPTGKSVTFNTTFSITPYVVATPQSTVPGTTVLGVSISSRSKTGCDIYLTRTNTSSTTVNYLAIGDVAYG